MTNTNALQLAICASQLFRRMLDQYDRLRRRNAFLDQYKKEKTFENGFEEFDESRLVKPLLCEK